jgi:RNA polymerase sigma-70 factor (ECF subfamily)
MKIDRTPLAERLWALGRDAWPAIDVPLGEVQEFVGSRLRVDPSLLERHASDVYLACACRSGAPAALDAFARTHLRELPRWLAKIDRRPDFVEEVRQILFLKLFEARDGAPPKIAEYAGEGPLGAWVRVAAVRLALDQRRATGPKPDVAERLAAQTAHGDPEYALLKASLRAEVVEALRGAWAALAPQAQVLLRLHHLEGVPVERLARTYGLSLPTAYRRIAEARKALSEDTLRRLREHLRLSSSEVEAAVGLVRSQLDVSLAHWLRETVA